ncbi:MAG TPA: type I glyceraldehyde-3-phosphate dehydrogenase [Bacteroidales bacterium]|nr:type I glyceraldehyde-3-phosphate dehydrogenase [Bacteroidales bacterium]
MPVKIGINGFGRIGKLVFRILQEKPDMEIVGINDPAPIETLAHLLKYDSAHGRFSGSIEISDNQLIINNKPISVYHERIPADIPRTMHGADIVIEASGLFTTREQLSQHLSSGARKVILTCPPKGTLDKTIIIGINENTLTKDDQIISNASCTANCAAPLLKILHENFGIEKVFMNTVHPATNNQRLIDAPHPDLRRSRTALTNIIPTTSTAVPVIKGLMPFLTDCFDGIATRVPVDDGSLIEFTAVVTKNTSVDEVNRVFRLASEKDFRGIVEYTSDPIVSSDIIGNPHSAIFDSRPTKVLKDNFVQIIGWYDNEYGYSSRVVDLIGLMKKFL